MRRCQRQRNLHLRRSGYGQASVHPRRNQRRRREVVNFVLSYRGAHLATKMALLLTPPGAYTKPFGHGELHHAPVPITPSDRSRDIPASGIYWCNGLQRKLLGVWDGRSLQPTCNFAAASGHGCQSPAIPCRRYAPALRSTAEWASRASAWCRLTFQPPGMASETVPSDKDVTVGATGCNDDRRPECSARVWLRAGACRSLPCD